MRLLTYERDGSTQPGALVDGNVVSLATLGEPARSVRALLAGSDAAALAALGERARAAGDGVALADVRLLAPVPGPEKVICIGLNYRDHAEETGQEIPQAPMWFAKFANSLVGSGAHVVLPAA